MAPEVIKGEAPTLAGDVFSFGVVLWELLTWQLPWGGALNPFQVGRGAGGPCTGLGASGVVGRWGGVEGVWRAAQQPVLTAIVADTLPWGAPAGSLLLALLLPHSLVSATWSVPCQHAFLHHPHPPTHSLRLPTQWR